MRRNAFDELRVHKDKKIMLGHEFIVCSTRAMQIHIQLSEFFFFLTVKEVTQGEKIRK